MTYNILWKELVKIILLKEKEIVFSKGQHIRLVLAEIGGHHLELNFWIGAPQMPKSQWGLVVWVLKTGEIIKICAQPVCEYSGFELAYVLASTAYAEKIRAYFFGENNGEVVKALSEAANFPAKQNEQGAKNKGKKNKPDHTHCQGRSPTNGQGGDKQIDEGRHKGQNKPYQNSVEH